MAKQESRRKCARERAGMVALPKAASAAEKRRTLRRGVATYLHCSSRMCGSAIGTPSKRSVQRWNCKEQRPVVSGIASVSCLQCMLDTISYPCRKKLESRLHSSGAREAKAFIGWSHLQAAWPSRMRQLETHGRPQFSI